MSASACAGVRLAAQHRERADDAGHQGDHAARSAAPRGPARWRRSPARRSAAAGAHERSRTGRDRRPAAGAVRRSAMRPARRPRPATTRIRSCTWITSTWWPYSSLSTSGRTTSSVGAAGGPAGRQVDDPVHDRQQRVHLVRRDQHGDLLLRGDPAEQRDDLLLAADVEVGQRLVEQQQPGTADQRVRDQDPLLLAAGQVADPGVGEPLGVDGVAASRRPAAGAGPDGSGMPSRCPSRPRPTRSRARSGMSGSSWIFCGT